MSYMVGVVAIIKDELRTETLRLWDLSQTKYNSKGVRSFEEPNLSFQGGQCDDIELLREALLSLGTSIEPFEIIVDGFGFFEKPSKVVYLKIVKTEELLSVHKRINELMSKYCRHVLKLYLPENWTPHITVAMEDLTDEKFCEFKKDLEGLHPYFVQKVSDIHLLRVQESGNIELIESFRCGN